MQNVDARAETVFFQQKESFSTIFWMFTDKFYHPNATLRPKFETFRNGNLITKMMRKMSKRCTFSIFLLLTRLFVSLLIKSISQNSKYGMCPTENETKTYRTNNAHQPFHWGICASYLLIGCEIREQLEFEKLS